MIHVFAVRDSAVDAFITPPLFMRSKGEAVRAFTDACQDSKHEFAKHARDYELFHLADFDDRSGAFVPVTPLSILRAIDCVVNGDVPS